MLIAAAAFALTIAVPNSGPSLAPTLAAVPDTVPPMIVNVLAAPTVTPSLVTRIIAETDAIWRDTGVSFLWQPRPYDAIAHARRTTQSILGAATLRVVIGDQVGVARDDGLALGWIVFSDQHPDQEIYLSFANAA